MENIKGPEVDPCGILVIIVNGSDKVFFKSTIFLYLLGGCELDHLLFPSLRNTPVCLIRLPVTKYRMPLADRYTSRNFAIV